MDGRERATQAFQQYTEALGPILGPRPGKAILEQHVCFAAAVWNAVTVLGAFGDESMFIHLAEEVRKLPEPEQAYYAELLSDLCFLKVRAFAGDEVVLRHVHVICAEGDALRIRAEAMDVYQWAKAPEPLRMGLPD